MFGKFADSLLIRYVYRLIAMREFLALENVLKMVNGDIHHCWFNCAPAVKLGAVCAEATFHSTQAGFANEN